MKSENNFYDHYKDTLSLQQTYLSERNKLTLTLLILVVLMAVFIYEPSMIVEKLNTILESRVKGLAFGMKYINTGLIFLFLWVLTRYYQTVVKIDRMYKYLAKCEKKLSGDKDEYQIDREGDFYDNNKSKMDGVLNRCYGYLLPIAIIFLAAIKIAKEISWATLFKIFDIPGLGFIILLSILYIRNVRKCEKEGSIDRSHQRRPRPAARQQGEAAPEDGVLA